MCVIYTSVKDLEARCGSRNFADSKEKIISIKPRPIKTAKPIRSRYDEKSAVSRRELGCTGMNIERYFSPEAGCLSGIDV